MNPGGRRLRIGRIFYTNLFPIFHGLEKGSDCSAYEFIDGVPSALNRLLREGDIDVSPSSSIEYLRHEDRYTLIEGHSISSAGPVGSILLFSRRPIHALEGLTILTSSQSETSVALLDIVLKKFYNVHCPLKSTDESLAKGIESHPAYLLIGDDALREALKWPSLSIYDLGDLWYRNTGLPAVFALWIARRETMRDESLLMECFKKDLDAAKAEALRNLRSIAQDSPLKDILTEDELVSYWQGISYDFDGAQKRGLNLFKAYAEELKLL